jgi:hypothetical protein
MIQTFGHIYSQQFLSIIKVELIAKVPNGLTVLQPLKTFTLKSPNGSPTLLFDLPKSFVANAIKKDGVLHLGIGFSNETILSNCVGYV